MEIKGLSRKLWFLIKELFCHKKIFLVWSFYLDEIHSLLDNPLILPQTKILISFWSLKAENQKFEIEEKVMSERVKMPNRHFLRSDYLHFFFYLKFLVFVSLVPQISYLIPHSHNCGFRVVRKKKNYPILDAASERV